jgi:hypothetical protein
MLFAVNALAPKMNRDRSRKPSSTSDEQRKKERRLEDGRRPDERRSVRLIRKYAEMIDGVDLEHASVGDRLELSPHDADVLIAEGWAEPALEDRPAKLPPRAIAADTAHNSTKKPKP